MTVGVIQAHSLLSRHAPVHKQPDVQPVVSSLQIQHTARPHPPRVRPTRQVVHLPRWTLERSGKSYKLFSGRRMRSGEEMHQWDCTGPAPLPADLWTR